LSLKSQPVRFAFGFADLWRTCADEIWRRLPAWLTLAVCLSAVWPAAAQQQSPTPDPSEAMLMLPVVPSDELAGLRQFATAKFDSGHLAWIMLGTFAALLLVTPGLAIFYCGVSRPVRVPQVLVEYLFLAAVLSLAWVLWIYSLAFSRNELSNDVAKREIHSQSQQSLHGNRFFGGTDHVALRGLDSKLENASAKYPLRRPDDAVPHLLFMVLQLGTFLAAAAPLAILLATSLTLPARAIFLMLWGTFVYAPIAYWLWGGGWHTEALDRAGGIVGHVSVGFSALSLAFSRRASGEAAAPAAELDLATVGTGTLLFWGGCLLCHASQSLFANAGGVNSLIATHLAACAGVIGWTGSEWLVDGKARPTGICLGAMSGLFAIAAGCGFVAPQSAILIGLAAAVACQITWRLVSAQPRANPFLWLFALQGIAGGLGVLLAGVFATASVAGVNRRGDEIRGLLSGDWEQLTVQGAALGSAAALAVVGTLLAAGVVRAVSAVTKGISPSGGNSGDHHETARVP
jgi:Amt family ammonium transporter